MYLSLIRNKAGFLKRVSLFSAFAFMCMEGIAQNVTPCVQTLRLARATYEQGRLHEIESQLKPCLNGGFNKDEKQLEVEGYKLLCLSYIYLEEPEKANEAMLNILKTDHDFQINPAVDPAEFVGLYSTFRTKSMFSVGLLVGPNMTFPSIKTYYSVSGNSSGKGTYTPKVNVQIGAVFEKHLFGKFTAAPEVLLTNHAFSYTNPALFTDDNSGSPVTTQTGDIKQSWLDLNVLVQYKLGKRALNSYVSIGPSVGLLMAGSNTVKTEFDNGQVISGSPIDLKPTSNKVGFSVIGTAGIKYKFGAIYLTANIRYQLGLSKIVNEEKKSDPEATYDYGLSPNIYTQQSTAFLVGFVLPIFSPKKLANKK
jgi:hypothetical protein